MPVATPAARSSERAISAQAGAPSRSKVVSAACSCSRARVGRRCRRSHTPYSSRALASSNGQASPPSTPTASSNDGPAAAPEVFATARATAIATRALGCSPTWATAHSIGRPTWSALPGADCRGRQVARQPAGTCASAAGCRRRGRGRAGARRRAQVRRRSSPPAPWSGSGRRSATPTPRGPRLLRWPARSPMPGSHRRARPRSGRGPRRTEWPRKSSPRASATSDRRREVSSASSHHPISNRTCARASRVCGQLARGVRALHQLDCPGQVTLGRVRARRPARPPSPGASRCRTRCPAGRRPQGGGRSTSSTSSGVRALGPPATERTHARAAASTSLNGGGTGWSTDSRRLLPLAQGVVALAGPRREGGERREGRPGGRRVELPGPLEHCQECEAGAALAGRVAQRVGDGVVDPGQQLGVVGELVHLPPELLESGELARLRGQLGRRRRACGTAPAGRPTAPPRAASRGRPRGSHPTPARVRRRPPAPRRPPRPVRERHGRGARHGGPVLGPAGRRARGERGGVRRRSPRRTSRPGLAGAASGSGRRRP